MIWGGVGVVVLRWRDVCSVESWLRADCGPSLRERPEGGGLRATDAGVEADLSASPASVLFYPLTLEKSFNLPEPQFPPLQNVRMDGDRFVGRGETVRRAAA